MTGKHGHVTINGKKVAIKGWNMTGKPLSTHEALLASIAGNPTDDTARLALADYLDEFDPQQPSQAAGEQRLAVALRAVIADKSNDEPRLAYAEIAERYGQTERAEAIRLGIYVATLGLPDGPCPEGCPCGGAGNRAAKLVDEFGDEWNPPLPGERPGSFHFDWRRGFPDSVTCSGADWIRHADLITANHPVRAVTLTTISLDWAHRDGNVYLYGGQPPHHGVRKGRKCLHVTPNTLGVGSVEKRIPYVAGCLVLEWPGIEFTLPPPMMIDGIEVSIGDRMLLRTEGNQFRLVSYQGEGNPPIPIPASDERQAVYNAIVGNRFSADGIELLPPDPDAT